MGVSYYGIPPTSDGLSDEESLKKIRWEDSTVGCVLIQRSKGYSTRKSLTIDRIERLCSLIHETAPKVRVFVDNCYGEFSETREPCEVGADLCAGSLIKNPGGGLAVSGGYIAGREDLVEKAAERLTVPGIGSEVGATFGQNRLLYQGLFLAPHTVAQAMKTAVFASALMKRLGYEVDPLPEEHRADIIQQIKFGKPEPLLHFCQGIQKGSPVDSFVAPVPWSMPDMRIL